MTENDNKDTSQEDSDVSQSLLNYTNKGTQTVISFLGIELTAPQGLKNPGIVYLSFIIINFILFIILRNFVSG